MKNKKYAILAIDHRGSFKKITGLKDKKKIIKLKQEIIDILGKYASAIIIDPVYGKTLKTKKPILVCMEKSGYRVKGKSRLTTVGFSIAKSKKMNAKAAKLNLFYNPNSPLRVLRHQQKIVEKIGKECKKNKIPFLLEILVYPINSRFNKGKIILESLDEFKQKKYNVNVFKLQYPGSALNCRKITEKIRKPWVLLSAGMTFGKFAKNLRIAVHNGCSGFAVGRAVWQKGICIKNPEKRAKWLKTKGVTNIKKLVKIL